MNANPFLVLILIAKWLYFSIIPYISVISIYIKYDFLTCYHLLCLLCLGSAHVPIDLLIIKAIWCLNWKWALSQFFPAKLRWRMKWDLNLYFVSWLHFLCSSSFQLYLTVKWLTWQSAAGTIISTVGEWGYWGGGFPVIISSTSVASAAPNTWCLVHTAMETLYFKGTVLKETILFLIFLMTHCG